MFPTHSATGTSLCLFTCPPPSVLRALQQTERREHFSTSPSPVFSAELLAHPHKISAATYLLLPSPRTKHTHLTTNYNGKLWKTFAEKNMFIWSPHHIFRWLDAHKKITASNLTCKPVMCFFFLSLCVCVYKQSVSFREWPDLIKGLGFWESRLLKGTQSCFSYDELGVLNIWAQVHPS